jgi:protease-4
MKSFLKMVLASTVGVFIAGIVMYLFTIVVLVGIVAVLGATQIKPLITDSALKIDLTGQVSDRITPNPFDFISKGEIKNYGLNDLLAAIRKAKTNGKIKGIYLNVGALSTGYASAQQIRRELLDFKESGKFITAYGATVSQNGYYIASVADRFFLNPEGIIDLRGLSATVQFEKGFYKNAGIEFQVYKVGTFKSAVEPYILDKMSEPNREQLNSVLGDIWKTMLTDISAAREIPAETLNAYIDEGIYLAPQQSLAEKKIIDEIAFRDEAEQYIKEQIGQKTEDKLKTASVDDVKSAKLDKKKHPSKIAILYAEGSIVDAPVPSFFAGESYITPREMTKELEKLRKDKDVKAVVLRVNSPGGSAIASEQINHAVRTLAKEKPVVVSMGTYAASGGYYISVNASKIVAEPTTITGSIGIFGLIPNAEQLSKKLGLTYDGVKTNRFADFGGRGMSLPLLGIELFPARPFNEGESKILQAYVERGYDTFLAHCAEGRGKTKAEIDAVGQGRIWSGNQALALGLVDKVGGIEDAVKLAAEISETAEYSVGEYPAPKTFFEDFFSASLDETRAGIVSFFMGKENFRQKMLMESWSRFDFRQAVLPVEWEF